MAAKNEQHTVTSQQPFADSCNHLLLPLSNNQH